MASISSDKFSTSISTTTTSAGIDDETARRTREAIESIPDTDPSEALTSRASIRDRLLGELEQEPFDFGSFNGGRRKSINFTETVGGSEDEDDVVGDFIDGRGYELPYPDEDTVCRLFGARVWESEQRNLRKLLRYTPPLSDRPTATEADYAARWCRKVARSIARMKKASNFNNHVRIDDQLNKKYWGENQYDVFIGRGNTPPGHPLSNPIDSLTYADDGGKADAPIPWVWFDVEGERATIRKSFYTSAMLAEYVASSWDVTAPDVFLAEAFRLQPGDAEPQTERIRTASGRYVRGRVGGRLTIRVLKEYASRYAGLPQTDAIRICFMAWMQSNFGVAMPGGIPRMGKKDALKYRVMWNKIKRVPPNTKNVDKSRIERDLGDFSSQTASVLQDTFRPGYLVTVLEDRRVASDPRQARDRAQRIMRGIEESLEAAEAAGYLPSETLEQINKIRRHIQELRTWDASTPEEAAALLGELAEITGDMAVVGEFTKFLTDAVDEVKQFGEDLIQAGEGAFQDAVEQAVGELAVQIGLDLAISVTVAGALSSLLGSAFSGIVEQILSSVLEALGFKESEPPPPEVVPPIFNPPLMRWPRLEASCDFERDASTGVLLRDFLDFMQDTQRVFAGNTMVFGLKTRRSPLEQQDCTPARVVYTNISIPEGSMVTYDAAGAEDGGGDGAGFPWLALAAGAATGIGGSYLWKKRSKGR